MKRCPKCGKFCKDKDVSLEPTLSQLIFGGWWDKREYRCKYCERKIAKVITKLLKDIK